MTTLNQIPTYIPVLTKNTKEVYDCYLAEHQIRRHRKTGESVTESMCERNEELSDSNCLTCRHSISAERVHGPLRYFYVDAAR